MSTEEKLEQLVESFSYYDFIDLLAEIDLHPNLSGRGQQLLFNIMKMTNDNYLVDGVPSTLGHMLLENKLINKEKITPTILFFFFEEQLEKIGVSKIPITFYGGNYDMCHRDYDESAAEEIDVNLNRFNKHQDVDSYNYEVMYSALHEIVHAYQHKCLEFSNDDKENLTAQNYANGEDFIKNFMGNSTESNSVIHDSLVFEIEADNNSMLYMIQIAQKNPEYFNQQLLNKKVESYKERLDYQHNVKSPYSSFEWLISYLEKLLKDSNQLTDEHIKKIDQIRTKNQNCEMIDNDLCSIDYNIFLKQYYTFDGEKLITGEEPISKISKGI